MLPSPLPCLTQACLHDLGQCLPTPVFKMGVMTQNLLTGLASFLCPSGNGVAALPCLPALCPELVGAVVPGSA